MDLWRVLFGLSENVIWAGPFQNSTFRESPEQEQDEICHFFSVKQCEKL